MGKVLLCTYVFPPVGGGGVQRTLAWCKHLPAFGWEPIVLTAGNPSVPLSDEALSRSVPAGLGVFRTRTFELPYSIKRSSWNRADAAEARHGGGLGSALARGLKAAAQTVLCPDPQVTWNWTARRAARAIIRRGEVQAILTSGPPFSTHLLGAALAEESGLPWVADFRDEWVEFYSRAYDFHRRGRSQVRVRDMEKRVVEKASAIVTVTQGILDNYRRRYPKLNEANSHLIPNGFDEEDFSGPPGVAANGGLVTLTYCGTVFSATSARPFLSALERLLGRRPGLSENLRVRFVGRIDSREVDAFESPALSGVISRQSYVPHDRAVLEMRSADALLLLLADLPGAERILTGKIFEYLAARRRILAVVPEGEASRLILAQNAGEVVSPNRIGDIEAAIEGLCDNPPTPLPPDEGITRYSRRRGAEQLSLVLENLPPSNRRSRA